MNEILNVEIASVPPSVNHYWMSSGKSRYLSAKAKAFTQLVGYIVKPHRSVARLHIELEFCFPDRKIRDIDNYLKGTLDSLVKAGLCVDDNQFDRIIVNRGEIVKGGRTTVRVWEVV